MLFAITILILGAEVRVLFQYAYGAQALAVVVQVQVFAAGKYETGQPAGWADGDWDANSVFDSSDLVAAFADGGYEQGQKVSSTAAVPEPASAALLLLAIAGWLIMRRHT